MKSIIVNIKNLIPYLLLIFIYFFFINIEARKNLKNSSKPIEKRTKITESNLDIKKENIRIAIPVIPYKD